MDRVVIDPIRLHLSVEETRRRARQVKLVLTDSDGVLTDNGVYYSARGEEMKRFSIRDGMGVERLRNAGIATGIVTGETSPSVVKRAEKLGLSIVHLGVKDKAARLATILADTRLRVEHVAFIGDDVNDLDLMRIVGEAGLTAAPSDAMPMVLEQAHYRATCPGGHGAFRDFAEWILRFLAEPNQ